MKPASALMIALTAGLAACTPTADDGIDPKGQTFAGIAPDEVVTLTGTEPFWNVRIAGEQANYSTPENIDGSDFVVARLAGNGGLSFSGTLDGSAFTATLTPGECSDQMSDRIYPYVATIALGEETLRGCGYTDRQPFSGPEAP